MSFVLGNRAAETSTSTGTGDFTLSGPLTAYRSLSSIMSTNDWTYYTIAHRTANEFEVGIGILTGSTTLQRYVVLDSSASGAPVDFSSGTKDVFQCLPQGAAIDDEASIFGNGSDGDVTLSVGNNYLTRNMQYNKLIFPAEAILIPNGFDVKVACLLDLEDASAGAIDCSGGVYQYGMLATGTNGGYNDLYGTYLPMGGAGASGGLPEEPGQGAPENTTQFTELRNIGRIAGFGGDGGDGDNAGGTHGSAGNWPHAHFPFWTPFYPTRIPCNVGGSGGGGGNATGGGGGGGGAGGNLGRIAARVIHRVSGSTAAGCMTAKGGDGANGTNASSGDGVGGGGGGGGPGGKLHVFLMGMSGSAVSGGIVAPGGDAGDGGNGLGSGHGGNGGDGGAGGIIAVTNCYSGYQYENDQSATAGAAGSTYSGLTGGAGGAGASCTANL